MDLRKIISDLETKVAAARAAAAELEQLEAKLEVARQLDAEYNGTATPASDERNVDWSSLTRSKAILQALRDSPRALSPKEIVAELVRHGRIGDKPNYVSASLANMKKSGQVVRRGFGEWAPADREPPGDPRIGDLLGVPRPAAGGR